jgi:hypothetical protein
MTDYQTTREATVTRDRLTEAEAIVRALAVIAAHPIYADGRSLRQCCDSEDGHPHKDGCPVGLALRWLG